MKSPYYVQNHIADATTHTRTWIDPDTDRETKYSLLLPRLLPPLFSLSISPVKIISSLHSWLYVQHY